MNKGSLVARERKHGTTWYLAIDFPTAPGQPRDRRQIRLDADNKEEAEQARMEKVLEIHGGSYHASSEQALGGYIDDWLEDHAEEEGLAPNTVSGYRSMVKNHIKPALGHMPLRELTPYHIKQLMKEKRNGGRCDGQEGGLADSTLKRIYLILNAALDHAVKWEMLNKNPTGPVKAPSVKQRPEGVRYIDPTLIEQYLQAAKVSPHYPLLFAALYTGMRQSELLGLQWDKVDGDDVHVHRQLNRDMDIVPYTKTDAGWRTIKITGQTVAVLDDVKARQAKEQEQFSGRYDDNNLVFSTRYGTPIIHRNALRCHKKTCRRAGMEENDFHSLRHTHATVLFNEGFSVKYVSQRLGHASTKITQDIYIHVIPSREEELVGQIDDAMTNSNI